MDKVLPGPEQTKLDSRYLRGTLADELANGEQLFSKPATAVLKFHGIYQQDDRDQRKAGPKQYSAMVRVGVPGGVLAPEQYLALDALADLADGSLRITTRQDFQFHKVPKSSVRELVRSVNENYLNTLAACGDVVRNVVSCSAPFDTEERRQLLPIVRYISRGLKPKTTAYYEVWMDGERIISAEQPEENGEVEPLYGSTYLPRKFKINFAFPGDNTTDLFANDIGIVPYFEDSTLAGFTILAAGGMGQTNGMKATHPRLADPICSIGPTQEELLEVCKAIVTIHRDFGNRTNRKLARLKYVMDAWGVEKFKQELDLRVGRSLAPPRELSWTRAYDYLGWHRQGTDENGRSKWFVGVRVISGRVRDFDNHRKTRTGLRTIIERFRPGVRLTAQQNLYLCDISDEDRPAVEALLREHGIRDASELPPILRHAMACPALPTCGLAVSESERIMPEVVAEIQAEFNQAGLHDQPVDLRTSGCPNGCSRPYTAEIGIVGTSVDLYHVYLGASPLGTRLGTLFAQNVKRKDLAASLRPVIELFGEKRKQGEGFGDFCHRIGIPALREATALTAA